VATDANQLGPQTPAASRRRPNLIVLHRRARAALAQALVPGEEPRILIAGLDATGMIATDRRVFVFKRGARAGLLLGSRLKAFDYESVLRVDVRRSGKLDVVVIHAPLMISSCSSYWVDDRDNPWRARNAIPVGRASAEVDEAVAELTRLVAAVRDRRRRVTEGRRVVGATGEPQPRDRRPDLKPVSTGLDTESIAPPEPEDENCPRCGNGLLAGWQFCPRCGAAARPEPARTTPRRRRP
jgi:hypothetical protein